MEQIPRKESLHRRLPRVYNITFLPPRNMTDARRRYYEWQTKGKDKLPHFTKHPDGKVMLLAGLYEETVDKSITFPSALALV